MNNIYLIGMPGCGKSTLGRALSKKLKRPLTDLDECIVRREGCDIPQLFALGEDVFRRAETEALREVASKEGLLVATGGGVVTTRENIAIMKQSGRVVFIDASVDFILENSSLEGRPLLKDKSKIHELYKNRIGLYRAAADVTVANDGIFSKVVSGLEQAIAKLK